MFWLTLYNNLKMSQIESLARDYNVDRQDNTILVITQSKTKRQLSEDITSTERGKFDYN